MRITDERLKEIEEGINSHEVDELAADLREAREALRRRLDRIEVFAQQLDAARTVLGLRGDEEKGERG